VHLLKRASEYMLSEILVEWLRPFSGSTEYFSGHFQD